MKVVVLHHLEEFFEVNEAFPLESEVFFVLELLYAQIVIEGLI